MANRRMISNDIILSDDFLELSNDAKLLWFYVVAGSDDDGYCNSVNALRRSNEISKQVLAELCDAGYLREIQKGVYHVEQWERFNKVQESRRVKSRYLDVDNLSTKCQQNADNLSQSIVEYSIVKDSINKDSIVKGSIVEDSISNTNMYYIDNKDEDEYGELPFS